MDELFAYIEMQERWHKRSRLRSAAAGGEIAKSWRSLSRPQSTLNGRVRFLHALKRSLADISVGLATAFIVFVAIY